MVRARTTGSRTVRKTRVAILLFAAAVVISACAGGSDTADESTPSTTAAPVTTVVPTTSTTTSTTTTTTTTLPPTPLQALGYPVSDDWVIETVVEGLDSATGGLAVDADGFFYQADFGYTDHPGDRVYRIAPDGTEAETLIQDDALASLTMTAIGPDGAIYQTAYGSGHVLRIDLDGGYEFLAEGLRGPTGIVPTADGTLYVDSFPRDSIYRILPDGTVEEDWVEHGAFWGLNGLTVGPDGTLYVINYKDGGLFAVDPEDGTVTNLHKFTKPTSHGVYHDGSLFVTSRTGYVVFRYDIGTGDVEIIIGNAEPGFSDGRGSAAQIGRPNAITVGPDGALYINHGSPDGNNPVAIRRITFQPEA